MPNWRGVYRSCIHSAHVPVPPIWKSCVFPDYMESTMFQKFPTLEPVFKLCHFQESTKRCCHVKQAARAQQRFTAFTWKHVCANRAAGVILVSELVTVSNYFLQCNMQWRRYATTPSSVFVTKRAGHQVQVCEECIYLLKVGMLLQGILYD